MELLAYTLKEPTGKPMPQLQVLNFSILLRGEMISAHAHARRLVEPDLPQAPTKNGFGSAMPAAD